MAFNDILKLRVHCRMYGNEVLNVMHFVDTGGLPGDQAQALANDFRDNMITTLRPRASGDMAFEFVEVIKIVPFGEGPRIANWAAATLGTAAGTSISATLCEVITVHSDQIGRRKRGRIYLSGAPAAASTAAAGLWTATQTTRTQAFATALAARYIADGGGSAFRLGIWSKLTAGPDPPWSTDAFTRATALTVRLIIRTQRRRQLGVGR